MSVNPFQPPTAEVLDSPVASARRPLSIWLLQIVLVVCVLLSSYGLLSGTLAIATHRFTPPSGAYLVFQFAWRIGVMAFVIAAILWIHRGVRAARWIGVAVLVGLAVLILVRPDTSDYANEAERAGGSIGRYVLLPLLFAWWTYAAAFSQKARKYFSVGHKDAAS